MKNEAQKELKAEEKGEEEKKDDDVDGELSVTSELDEQEESEDDC